MTSMPPFADPPLDVRPAEADATAFGRVVMAKAPFSQAVLVCRKCARKLPGKTGAKDIRKTLKMALKRLGPAHAWGKVRIVEASCFDLCPKRRQVLASGATLRDRKLVVVEPGFDAEAVLERLLG
jgi:hypothetical protein